MHSVEFQKEVLHMLSMNLKFALNFGLNLKPDYFDTQPLRILFSIMSEHILEYERELDYKDCLIKIENYIIRKGYSTDIFKALKDEASSVYNTTVKSEQFILDEIVKFTCMQELKTAMMKSLDIIEKGGDPNAVLKLIDQAVSIGAGSVDGQTFADLIDLPTQLKLKYNSLNMIKSGFSKYDYALLGGMAQEELHVIMAPPKSGKTTLACNMGAFGIASGKAVFHSSHEIKMIDVLTKYAVRLTGMTYKELIECDINVYAQKMKKFVALKPNLFVKDWEEGAASALNVRAWISRERAKTGLSPALIIIDYDDCLVPVKGTTGDMYNDAGLVYNDLLSLASTFQCFPYDTQIITSEGSRQIGSIDEGEAVEVLSRDTEGNIVKSLGYGLGQLGKDDELIELEFEDGHIVRCTKDHKFMLEDGSYKEAQDLTEYDLIATVTTGHN